MLGAIFFKEYLKVRRPWFTLLAANAALMAYILIHTRQAFALNHAEIVWYQVMHLGHIHFGQLKYAPLISGMLIACMQHLPETIGERLRLSLHLPIPTHSLILTHVLVGLAAVGIVIGLDMLCLALIMALYFPAEMVSHALLTALPWGLAGLAAYLGVTLAMLEPEPRRKLFNLGLAAGVVGLFLHQAKPEAYRDVVLLLILPVLTMIPAVLSPAFHFRFRRVS